MTQPAPIATPLRLPEMDFPALSCVISNVVFPSSAVSDVRDRARQLLESMAAEPRRQMDFVVQALQAAQQQGQRQERQQRSAEMPLIWILDQPHPFVPEMRIVRMFLARGGVEIYSLSGAGDKGIRNFIPMSEVRLLEENMPMDVFVDEMRAAEEGDEEDDVIDEELEGNEAADTPAQVQVTPSEQSS